MAVRRRYIRVGPGEFAEISEEKPGSAASAAVHQDTIDPLWHPVDDRVYDSKSAYLKRTRELGLEVVGNEKLSGRPQRIRDDFTESKVMDGIAKAEAIMRDPAKRRAYANMNLAMAERNERLLNGSRR